MKQDYFKSKRFVAAEVLTAAVCPFDCKYCYIPKTEELKRIHSDTLKTLETGEFIKTLDSVVGPNLEYLGLWGTEPTLTMKAISDKLPQLKTTFPKLKELSFSTSLFVYEPIVELAKVLSEVGIDLKFQVSLDGPDWIVAITRGTGVYKKVTDNVLKFVEATKNLSLNNKIVLRWKSTLPIEALREFTEHPEKIDDFYKTFNDLETQIKPLLNKNLQFHFGSYNPTLAVPGKYTVEDGRTFAKFCKHVREKGYTSTYTARFRRLIDFYPELYKKSMFTCSGGDSNIGLSTTRNICHRSFYLDSDDYISAILKTGIENWDISLFDKGLIDNLRKTYIPKLDDPMGNIRFDYIMRGYHDYWKFAIQNTKSLLYELALSGQVSKIYLNDDISTLFGLFTHSGLSCPMENILNTGNIFTTPISLLRMFGNGAFEELILHENRK